jgi:hypothetical protein
VRFFKAPLLWASFEQAGGSMTILQKNLRKESFWQ